MKVPAAGEDRKFMVFGAVDCASGRFVYHRSEQKGEAAFLTFLEYLAQELPADEPLVLVLDNAGYHKSHELRALSSMSMRPMDVPSDLSKTFVNPLNASFLKYGRHIGA